MKPTPWLLILFIGIGAASMAAPIASGEPKTSTLKFGAKETWTIDVTAGANIMVGLGFSSTTNGSLYVSGGIIDPFGLPVALILPTGKDVGLPIVHTAVYSGTYSISVECFRLTSVGVSVDDTFTYRLEVLLPKAGAFSVSSGDEGGALTNGLSGDGTILGGDIDVWTFSASAGEFFIIDLTLIPEPDGSPASVLKPLTILPAVRIYNPNGSTGRTTNSNGYGSLTWTDNAGVHTVTVSSGSPYYGGPQRYRIRKISVPSLFQVSAGEQGGPLTNGQTHQGTIGYYNVDCWTIPASVGDSITIRVNKTAGATFVPRLTIYMPSEGRQGYLGFGEQSITYRPTINGIHTLVVENQSSGFSTGSYGLFVSGATSPTPPVISVHPASRDIAQGATLGLSVTATGAAPLSYQWRRDGVAINNATTATLTIANAQTVHSGAYSVVVTNASGSVTSDIANVTVSPAIACRISNVSVRTTMAANQTLIVGLSMSGGSKPVLFRAVGPGLEQFRVPGTMPDPRLAVFNGSTQEEANDNWGGAAALATASASVGAFALPPASLDAVILRPVEGGRTAQVTGTAGGGVIMEAYDAGTGNSPRLVNISARNRVGTGDDILIAGFTISGTGSKTVLIRAVGPTLTNAFGLPGTLVDPKLEVYSGPTKIHENDTWAPTLASTFAGVGAFALTAGSKDAALVVTLPAGGYTVQVRGADGGAGEALVEIYEVSP